MRLGPPNLLPREPICCLACHEPYIGVQVVGQPVVKWIPNCTCNHDNPLPIDLPFQNTIDDSDLKTELGL